MALPGHLRWGFPLDSNVSDAHASQMECLSPLFMIPQRDYRLFQKVLFFVAVSPRTGMKSGVVFCLVDALFLR